MKRVEVEQLGKEKRVEERRHRQHWWRRHLAGLQWKRRLRLLRGGHGDLEVLGASSEARIQWRHSDADASSVATGLAGRSIRSYNVTATAVLALKAFVVLPKTRTTEERLAAFAGERAKVESPSRFLANGTHVRLRHGTAAAGLLEKSPEIRSGRGCGCDSGGFG